MRNQRGFGRYFPKVATSVRARGRPRTPPPSKSREVARADVCFGGFFCFRLKSPPSPFIRKSVKNVREIYEMSPKPSLLKKFKYGDMGAGAQVPGKLRILYASLPAGSEDKPSAPSSVRCL